MVATNFVRERVCHRIMVDVVKFKDTLNTLHIMNSCFIIKSFWRERGIAIQKIWKGNDVQILVLIDCIIQPNLWFFHSIQGIFCTGGVTCHDFGYGCAAGVPEPHPIHIPGQVKNMTHSYTSHIENWPHSYTIFENWPHSYTIFQFLPIHILFGEKDTPLIYFWCKNDTHSYTGRPEKYTPFQPHICIYLYNGSYPPPPRDILPPTISFTTK